MIDRVTCDYVPAGRVHLPRGEDSDGGGGYSLAASRPTQSTFLSPRLQQRRAVSRCTNCVNTTSVSKKRRRGGKAYTQNVPAFYRASHFLSPHLIFFNLQSRKESCLQPLIQQLGNPLALFFFFSSYSPNLRWQVFFFIIIQKVSTLATCSSPVSLTTLFPPPPLCHISGTESCLT